MNRVGCILTEFMIHDDTTHGIRRRDAARCVATPLAAAACREPSAFVTPHAKREMAHLFGADTSQRVGVALCRARSGQGLCACVWRMRADLRELETVHLLPRSSAMKA